MIKAEPIKVTSPLKKIVGWRVGICEGCEWHPDVCKHCQNSLHPDNNPEVSIGKGADNASNI